MIQLKSFARRHLPRPILTALKFVLTAAALGLVYAKLDWQQLRQAWHTANHWLLVPAFLCVAASKAASIPRLGLHLAAAGCRIEWYVNARLYLAGLFYNLFLPGGIGGDGYKAYWLHRNRNLPIPKLIWALFLDRLSGLFALGLWTAVLFFASELSEKLDWTSFQLLVLSTLGIHAALWIRSLLWSTLVQGLQLLAVWLLLAALGLDANQLLYLLVFLASSVVSTVLPITLGGLGSREVVFALGAEALGLDQHAAVLVAFLFFLLSTLLSFAGVYYVHRSERIATAPLQAQPIASSKNQA